MTQNPLMERIERRMRDDDAMAKLNRHWSVRLERALITWPAWRLGLLGMAGVAEWWTVVWEPVTIWLHDRQRRFLLSRYW